MTATYKTSCTTSEYKEITEIILSTLKATPIRNTPEEYSFFQKCANKLRAKYEFLKLEDIVLSRNYHYSIMPCAKNEVSIGGRRKSVAPLISDIASIAISDLVRGSEFALITPCSISGKDTTEALRASRLLFIAPAAMNQTVSRILFPSFAKCDLDFADVNQTEQEIRVIDSLLKGTLKDEIFQDIDAAREFVMAVSEQETDNGKLMRFGYTMGVLDTMKVTIKTRFDTMTRFLKSNPETNAIKFMGLLAGDIRRTSKSARHELTHIVYDGVRNGTNCRTIDMLIAEFEPKCEEFA